MSVGRGRGRGFAEVRETPLRRPGQSFTPKFSALINFIENLSDNEVNSKVDDIAQLIIDSTKNNSLREVYEDLHNQAFEDNEFGLKLAIACSHPKIYSIHDCNFRWILLQTLQKNYEEREEIKKKSVRHFRNSVRLLGEVYCRFKINGKFLDILADPLLHYLNMLLESSEEEDIVITADMIILNGGKMFDASPVEFEDFTIKVRKVLIYRNLSANSRAALVFIIDHMSENLSVFDKLKEFYCDAIEPIIAVELKRTENVDKNNTHFKRSKNKPLQPIADNAVGNVTQTPKQGNAAGFGTHEKSPPSAVNEKPSVPRAIRGAGAVDSAKDKNAKKSPRGKKDKLTDEQIWSSKQNISSKVWGHDDRFEKDY